MGEAKRRAAASPDTTTMVDHMLSEIRASLAALAPAPMNGADEIGMSPGDFSRFCVHAEAQPFDGGALLGMRVSRDDRLIDGVLAGRRNGKVVWSNVPEMLPAIIFRSDPIADDPTLSSRRPAAMTALPKLTKREMARLVEIGTAHPAYLGHSRATTRSLMSMGMVAMLSNRHHVVLTDLGRAVLAAGRERAEPDQDGGA